MATRTKRSPDELSCVAAAPAVAKALPRTWLSACVGRHREWPLAQLGGSVRLRSSRPLLLAQLGLTFALVSTAAGCASVIGADDFQVGVKPTTGGDAGSATSADGGVDAGDGATPGPLTAGSGESLCAPGCPGGLTCTTASFGVSGVCSAPCTTDRDCSAGHSCIGATDLLAYSCMKVCPTESCPQDFVCVQLSNGPATCFPHDWVLGVGDPCTSGGECPSGMCYGAPSGFCTRTCTPGDACAGGYSGFNVEGDRNACTSVNGGYLCVPGCNVDPTCGAYTGTTCRTLVSGAAVCVP